MSHLRLTLAFALFAATMHASATPQKQIVAYVFPNNSAIQPGQIDPHSITRINYAFAVIQDGRIVPGFAHDKENLDAVTALRQENPSLAILVSVGGWLGSGGFSEAAFTSESRARFIDSVMDFLHQHDLDGLDVDWEYPGEAGAGHSFRPEDKQNFTLLLRELRQRFSADQKKTHRRLYLTMAAGASSDFIAHTEMAEVARTVDSVNLMAYDNYEPGSGPLTGHHAALFTNPADPIKASGDAAIQAFEAAGVPAEKLILGIPFYGHSWSDVPDQNHGLYQPGKPGPNGSATFDLIQSTMLGHGYTRYWDSVSQVPWLYNSETHTFVSYEDEQSVAAKCRYVLAHKVAGVMFWDLESDSGGKLLHIMDETLR
ncbi:MAG TPA: glycoside hydrolase family 18 protein [Terracidiphilus sp.]|jgi:chitinase|nr:glycoside hydrolase family 18 protein [Terracidiphilus sp.]